MFLYFYLYQYHFIWIKERELFNSTYKNTTKEILTYIFVTSSLKAWFISELWYFIDIINKSYKWIRKKNL